MTDVRQIGQRLPNGLRVVVVPLPNTHRVVLSAHLSVGPRFERPADNGISHFLEHMLYRGTPRNPSAHEQALAFERLGGTLVAITGVESGTMAIGVPPESFSPTLDLFAEVYAQPVFSGIEIEKNIVREEILESLDDDGREIDADQLMRRMAFPDHPLGAPITGTLAELERFDETALARHHRAHYVANNSVLCVTGRIDPEPALAAIERCFAALPEARIDRGPAPAAAQGPRFSYVRHTASSQTAIRIGFRAPAERDPLEPATDVLLRVLDDGMSTRLYHHICDERGLCYDVSAGYEAYSDAGLVDLAADAAHERAGVVLDELFAVVRRLRDEGPHDDELDKAKSRHRWQLDALADDPGELADFYGHAELAGLAPGIAARRALIDAVSRDDVRRAAHSVFDKKNLSVVAVGMLPRRLENAMARAVDRFD